jgi:hypothetical protein
VKFNYKIIKFIVHNNIIWNRVHKSKEEATLKREPAQQISISSTLSLALHKDTN